MSMNVRSAGERTRPWSEYSALDGSGFDLWKGTWYHDIGEWKQRRCKYADGERCVCGGKRSVLFGWV